MLQLVTSHKNFNEELMQISRHVENAEGYGRVTDVLFASAVTYGRLYVWKTFSRILYETLAPNERKKWTLYTTRNGGLYSIVAICTINL